MQANCPQCSQKLVVDDAKVPNGPFMLKCPKCQAAMKLPGKGGMSPSAPNEAGKSAVPPEPSAVSAPPPAATAPPPSPPQASSQPSGLPHPSNGGSAPAGRALVALADPSTRDGITASLKHAGYEVELAPAEEGIRLLEREAYAVVATSRNGDAGGGGLYKRVAALAPEMRRDLFLVLIDDEFASGDGTQAFAAMADLVLHPQDSSNAVELLRSTLFERSRLYQAYRDAWDRQEERR